MHKSNFFSKKITFQAIFIASLFGGMVNACVPYFLHKEFIPSQEEFQYVNTQTQGNLVFSENGKTLVFGSHYLGKVKVFNLINGQWILKGSLRPFNPNDRDFNANSRGVHSIAILPDGKSIAFGEAEAPVHLWHLNEDNDEWVCGESLGGFTYPAFCMKFLENNLIILKTNQSLQVWQKRESGQWHQEYLQDSGLNFSHQFSASRGGLVIGSVRQRLYGTDIDILTKNNENCWNLLPDALSLPHSCSAIRVSQDGEMITLGLWESGNKGSIRLFNRNALTGKLDFIQELDPHSPQKIASITISLNKDIIVASDYNRVYVWNKNDDGRWNFAQNLCDCFDNQDFIISVDISIDSVIAIGFKSGLVRVYFPAYFNPVERKKNSASLIETEDRVNQEPQPLDVENPSLEQEQESVLGNLRKRKPKRKNKNRSKRKKLTHQEEQERDLESVFVENSCTLI